MSDDEAHDGAFPDEVVVPIEEHIDLHPYRPRDIRSVVESYLEQALERGFREVRLIHGRGVGVQREIVRSLLSKHPAVSGFTDATSDRGGWGATIVRLAPPDEPEPAAD